MKVSPFVFLSGQQRSRMLATLFKDERCQQLATYGILEKMYLDRIIRGNQLQEFAAMLMPHQKATTADGGLNQPSLTSSCGSLGGEAVFYVFSPEGVCFVSSLGLCLNSKASCSFPR